MILRGGVGGGAGLVRDPGVLGLLLGALVATVWSVAAWAAASACSLARISACSRPAGLRRPARRPRGRPLRQRYGHRGPHRGRSSWARACSSASSRAARRRSRPPRRQTGAWASRACSAWVRARGVRGDPGLVGGLEGLGHLRRPVRRPPPRPRRPRRGLGLGGCGLLGPGRAASAASAAAALAWRPPRPRRGRCGRVREPGVLGRRLVGCRTGPVACLGRRPRRRPGRSPGRRPLARRRPRPRGTTRTKSSCAWVAAASCAASSWRVSRPPRGRRAPAGRLDSASAPVGYFAGVGLGGSGLFATVCSAAVAPMRLAAGPARRPLVGSGRARSARRARSATARRRARSPSSAHWCAQGLLDDSAAGPRPRLRVGLTALASASPRRRQLHGSVASVGGGLFA